ncbi:hypothetical protein XELAEV_18030544mg [Xenopus laevis]|uniref:Uncharacterized protein n=1 Tax=Xenopus laevis TaxID=8355 RepID=A0A974HEU4_XENLA|nr:hypothetical protein XELAEV_18030544mg [Xenopus laevis]
MVPLWGHINPLNGRSCKCKRIRFMFIILLLVNEPLAVSPQIDLPHTKRGAICGLNAAYGGFIKLSSMIDTVLFISSA